MNCSNIDILLKQCRPHHRSFFKKTIFRPLTKCPTLNGGSSKHTVSVALHENIKSLKLAIQDQLNRGSQLNFDLLDPGRQILYDPVEGHELQDHMPHGFRNGQKVKLSLKPLPPPENAERPAWNAAFIKSQTLVPKPVPFNNRQIRDVNLETTIFRSGGTPDLACSFALAESEDLGVSVEAEIDQMSVPQREWHHVDIMSERSVYTKSAAPEGALCLARSTKGFTTSYPYPVKGRGVDIGKFQRW